MNFRDVSADHSEYAGFHDAIRSASTGTRVMCAGFQRALSALFDGEVPEQHARKALAHLEACSDCSDFFHAVRLQALAHRDMTVPGSLARRLRRLPGRDIFEGLTDAEIVRRLAATLYELGKAYALAGTDGEYLMRIAEEPVEIDSFESGELKQAAQLAEESGACNARFAHMVGDVDSHLEKARGILSEALRLKPRFAEAHIYLGFVHQAEGHQDLAKAEYLEVFLNTDRLQNRAHAAIQLGLIHDRVKDHRRALRYYRWVVSSGLVHHQPEFAFVLYNIAVEHISLDEMSKALEMLSLIRNDYSELWPTVMEWLTSSEHLLEALRGDHDCRVELQQLEPAFFAA
ncbi:MAG: zf-HC2 domain-containing protein [Planctomycetota bacterium]|jgi:tetratricopeptide (TPR) repeat protein|nr:zf-HC2 domain-containing protein [Planctomycetota bacterium]